MGEGGRGDGFIACATDNGIVGMLHEEITGPITSYQYCMPSNQLIGTYLNNHDQLSPSLMLSSIHEQSFVLQN